MISLVKLPPLVCLFCRILVVKSCEAIKGPFSHSFFLICLWTYVLSNTSQIMVQIIEKGSFAISYRWSTNSLILSSSELKRNIEEHTYFIDHTNLLCMLLSCCLKMWKIKFRQCEIKHKAVILLLYWTPCTKLLLLVYTQVCLMPINICWLP